MTYCVGWVHRGCVYLVADSAVTGPDRITRVAGSVWGEVHDRNSSGQFVEEGSIKLTPIGPGVAAAMAGDGALARRICLFLNENYSESWTIEDLLRSASISLDWRNQNVHAELLIATVGPKSHAPSLIKWSSRDGGKILYRAQYCEIGYGMPTYLRAALARWVDFMGKTECPPQVVIASVTAICQSFGAHDPLLPLGVGGTIFGLFVQDGETHWQADTNLALWDQTPGAKLRAVREFVRENILFIIATTEHSNRYFPTIASRKKPAWLDENYLMDRRTTEEFNQWHFCTLISLNARRVTLLVRRDPRVPSRYVNHRIMDKVKPKFAYNPELISFMNTPIEPEPPSVMRCRLGVLTDPDGEYLIRDIDVSLAP